jgi:riboflavin kinase/FMN adenylyltransferase
MLNSYSMRIVTSLSEAASEQPSVLSIGNFDGLHLGHRAILETVIKRARALRCRAAAITFSPHPIRFLAPYKAPKLISTLEQKKRLIASTGIDLLYVVNFDETFSRLSPREFIEEYLVRGMGSRSVCVGSNFNFGYRGSGSVQTLREWSRTFEVIEVPPVQVRGEIVSSTRIRDLIAAGNPSKSCRMLGQWYELEGRIVPGAGRGRVLTVPTFNLSPDNELVPGRGVYVSRISLGGGPFLDAVTNVGTRPTFGETGTTIETFVLPDDKASLDQPVESARLLFLRRLRDEAKFESADALRRQISTDVGRARKFFRLLSACIDARFHSR